MVFLAPFLGMAWLGHREEPMRGRPSFQVVVVRSSRGRLRRSILL